MGNWGSVLWHAGFLFIALSGAGFYLLRRRRFDFCALAFFGACFYFLPGFLGFAGYAEEFILTPVPLAPETYAVMCWVLVATIAFGLVADAMGALGPTQMQPIAPPVQDPWRFTGLIATVAAVVGFALACVTVGDALLDADKFGLLERLNRWYLLWTTGAVLGLAVTFMRGEKGLFFVNLLLLIANLYVGFRVDLVIAVLAVGSLAMSRRGAIRLASHWRLGALVLVFGISLFAYKYILFAVKALDWDVLVAQLRNPDAFKLMFLYSEPFVAQGTLNEVIKQDYVVGGGHLLGALALLVPFANELGAEVTGFNELFQPTLFSSVTGYGLGSNIWAEMWAIGGWAAVTAFTAGYGLLLGGVGRYLPRVGPESAALLATLGVYWAFYIHRNDIIFQLTLSRRILMAWVLFALLSVFLNALLRRLREIADGSMRNPEMSS